MTFRNRWYDWRKSGRTVGSAAWSLVRGRLERCEKKLIETSNWSFPGFAPLEARNVIGNERWRRPKPSLPVQIISWLGDRSQPRLTPSLRQSKSLKKSNPLFDELIVIDDPTPRPGPLNMAIDEVLLSMARPAILRFYRWHTPSVSFGYFVRFAEACELAGNRAVVRRWTGGGIVPHGDDLTYSIMIGSKDDAFALPSKIIYQRVHSTLGSALREI